ncbi:transposase [Halanaeroarchaeum sulfurireducens]|uniref:Transposase n=1 Tax=Halanaeroarchaeum sulfurireducens TaxID=1604004 RepID=A0A0F7PBQ4_9EURY|nr:transposase [Halanaeroarchaeum sulfurireducens]ALG83048.1 transposase [Halanaeroarchaeum sulfurireducens]
MPIIQSVQSIDCPKRILTVSSTPRPNLGGVNRLTIERIQCRPDQRDWSRLTRKNKVLFREPAAEFAPSIQHQPS